MHYANQIIDDETTAISINSGWVSMKLDRIQTSRKNQGENVDSCHGTSTVDGVKFINSTCLKIEQNHISSCSLTIITYEFIIEFSYSSSVFMQIRLKKMLLAVLLVNNLAKYNKEINMTVKLFLITFKQLCVITFPQIFQIF